MDLRKIKIPGYYWRHHSAGNMYRIIRVVEGPGEYIVDWNLYYKGEGNSTTVEITREIIHAFEMNKFYPTDIIPIEARRMIFKGIFHQLEISGPD